MDRTELEILEVKGKGLLQPLDRQLLTWLITQLGTLAMCRQAVVDPETLKFFAQCLSTFHPKDLSAAIEKLCHKKREAGETAFPDLPTIEEEVIEQCNRRRRQEREEGERAFREEQEKHRAAHPEEYFTLAELYEAVMAKRRAAGAIAPEEVDGRSTLQTHT